MLKHTVTLLSFIAPNTFRVFLAAGKTKMSNFRKLFWFFFFIVWWAFTIIFSTKIYIFIDWMTGA